MENVSRRQPPPLRIALIASSLRLGGAEKQFVYMARALFADRLDAQVFYLGTGGYYETVLRELGAPLRQIHHPNRPLLMLARLIKALLLFRPQIVFAPQFGDLRFAGPAGRLCRAVTIGGLRSDGFFELNTHGRWSRGMLRFCHGLIANSSRAKENILSSGVKSPPIAVLPNVIHLQEFDERCKLPIAHRLPSDRVIVAAIGTLQPCKRFDRFLDALAMARRKSPGLFGFIAGAGPDERTALQQRATGLGLLPDHFLFVGESDRVPALLARAQALVLSSEYEGFPNVLLEAMAARLPVITTPVGDAPQIVQSGKTGYIIGGDDIKGMADCLVRLAQSPELRKKLGEAGRQRVEEEYQCDSLSSRLLALFQKFAGQL